MILGDHNHHMLPSVPPPLKWTGTPLISLFASSFPQLFLRLTLTLSQNSGLLFPFLGSPLGHFSGLSSAYLQLSIPNVSLMLLRSTCAPFPFPLRSFKVPWIVSPPFHFPLSGLPSLLFSSHKTSLRFDPRATPSFCLSR